MIKIQTKSIHENEYFKDKSDLKIIDFQKQQSLSLSPGLSSPTRLIDKIQKRIDEDKRWFSLEFFPPKTEKGAANLISKFDCLANGKPLFCDITWHSNGDPSSDKPTSSTKIAAVMLNYCGLDAMLHITCYHQTADNMKACLDKAKYLGIRNLLALRGDPAVGTEWEYQQDGFNHAVDLVKFIKKHYGDYFVICVAGYPHGHPDSKSYEDDLIHLKEKVDAGADFIITQLFFKADYFIKYVKDCRRIGIKCPIIPGILPIQSYDSLRHICKLSKLEIPTEIKEAMENLKDNDEAIRAYGIESAVKLCQELFVSGLVHGLHFYTLNREHAVKEILTRLSLWDSSSDLRPYPWKQCINEKRQNETVRPIFWSTRPKSYLNRTEAWSEFPNGRWGNSSSPSFGDLKDYHLFFSHKHENKDELLKQWGYQLENEADVWNVFHLFISDQENANKVKVKDFPWCEEDLSPETSKIRDKLSEVNKKGILTINSQPNVNGVPSENQIFGWGNKNGYVYQKAYLEFFTSKENLEYLLKALVLYPQINYHIKNKDNSIDYKNCDTTEPIAVTWGVFPGKEIIQPTVVDPISFQDWKDEAFNLWIERWGNLYDKNSKSRIIIEDIANNYILVNLVDNDYPEENCLWSLLDTMFKFKEQIKS